MSLEGLGLLGLLLAAPTGATGCDGDRRGGMQRALVSAGFVDPSEPPAITAVVHCNQRSRGPCGATAVVLVSERIARALYGRRGSELIVYADDENGAASRRVATFLVPARTGRGERAEKAAEDRFVLDVRSALCSATTALLPPRPSRRSSIAEALEEIVLSRTTMRRTEIFVLSDGREVSAYGDFECRRLPTVADFRARLRRHGLFAPGSFSRTRVHWVTGDHEAPTRRYCPVSMGRERVIQAVWRGVLTAAGAEAVTFETEVPTTERVAALFEEAAR